MFQASNAKNSLETTTCYSSLRAIWIEVALGVAALGLIIFGTTAHFEIGVFFGLSNASYFAYGAWAGAVLLVGGAVAKYFNTCSRNTQGDLTQQNQISGNDILDPVPYPRKKLEPLSANEDPLQAKLTDSFHERTEQKSHFRWSHIQGILQHELKHDSTNEAGPDDSKVSNLFLKFQDPEIQFICREDSRACSAFNIFIQNNMELLTQKLATAFLDGKKMVFAILNTGGHSIASGFSSDGSFVIVDSLCQNRVDHQKIAQMLNEAKLKDHKHKEIHFNGQFINTHIQIGGHECLRFATLYCYHMAVRKDLTAFEEVNGAFLQGRLRCFEDYNNITGSPRIQSLEGKTCNYRTFMISWLYRTFDLLVNAWWQLTLNEFSVMQGESNDEMMSCRLSKSRLPEFYFSSQSNLEIVSSSGQSKKITAQTVDTLNLLVNPDLHEPMEDALFKDNQSYLLAFLKNDSQPYLYPLQIGEKIEYTELKSSQN